MQKEVLDKISELMTVAFGLVAALAWNQAIQEWFKTQPWLASGGPWIYAIVVTIIAVVMTLYIGKLAKKAGEVSDKAVKKVKV